jgi:hypothetical protein
MSIIFPDTDPFPSVLGYISISYSNAQNKINWKGKFNNWMPAGWVLADLLTRKIKFRCIKSTVLSTLPLWNSKHPDPYQVANLYQSERSDPYQSERRIWIRIKVKSRISIRIKVKSRIRVPIKMVWIRNTSYIYCWRTYRSHHAWFGAISRELQSDCQMKYCLIFFFFKVKQAKFKTTKICSSKRTNLRSIYQ